MAFLYHVVVKGLNYFWDSVRDPSTHCVIRKGVIDFDGINFLCKIKSICNFQNACQAPIIGGFDSSKKLGSQIS